MKVDNISFKVSLNSKWIAVEILFIFSSDVEASIWYGTLSKLSDLKVMRSGNKVTVIFQVNIKDIGQVDKIFAKILRRKPLVEKKIAKVLLAINEIDSKIQAYKSQLES